MDQMSLFDFAPEEMEAAEDGKLKIVRAEFKEVVTQDWSELFDGFDELYGITFSSGIQFMEKVLDKFDYAELIFGCEDILSSDMAAIISTQLKTVELLVKSKIAKRLAERIEEESLDIRVSRDTMSHEKIFILKAKDGRTRVITGSANLSASAFLNRQREDIVCFDDKEAFEYYMDRFESFRDICSDEVSNKVIAAVLADEDYVRENIDEVPIVRTVEKKQMVILEPSAPVEEIEIVADIKGLEAEIKPLLPKQKEDNGKVLITGDQTRGFKRKYKEQVQKNVTKKKMLPKLHIDYELKKLLFNGKELNLNPSADDIKKDIDALTSYINSLSGFYGETELAKQNYFKFLNWFFCSPFMPYLRYIGNKYNYPTTSFPVFGILYGDSNGGKTTFTKLLSKMLCGQKIPVNSNNDFTSSNIEGLKCSCEGLPIIIDDLSKNQYDSHYEKVFKDDTWGLREHFINYPSIVISTNKLAALKPDISKRVVTCRIDIQIEKEAGAYNAKKINESLRQITNAFYCEYARRMFVVIDEMVATMTEDDENYFPDIFQESSKVISEIIDEYGEQTPDYVSELKYADYFGDMAIGRGAIDKIKTAWNTEPQQFKIDEKKNQLTYSYPEGGRFYELSYIHQELPPSLGAKLSPRSIVMKLDVARDVFAESFKKSIFDKFRA